MYSDSAAERRQNLVRVTEDKKVRAKEAKAERDIALGARKQQLAIQDNEAAIRAAAYRCVLQRDAIMEL